MSKNSDGGSHETNTGIGFLGALTLLFIALKLLGKISWSWVWVLCPLWIPAACGLIIILFFLIIFFLKK